VVALVSPDRRSTARARTGLEELEVALLLEGIQRHYGFDFRSYLPAPLRRRLLETQRAEEVHTVSGLQERLLHDVGAFERFVTRVSVISASLFREPSFYRGLRRHVVPALRENPRPRLWLMGCATGEELYSVAVTLREEGLTQIQIYATDIHEAPLAQAASGSFAVDKLRSAELGYRAAGGRDGLDRHYTVHGDAGVFNPELRKNVVFASHNFVTDASFNQFDVILSRGVLPCLGSALQGRVHQLFYESLPRAGFLALGRPDDLKQAPFEPRYEIVDGPSGLFRKRR
jgi:chemotaxis protein methyltransferase CheR